MSLAALVKEIATSVEQFGSVAKVPANAVTNVRNDMYLASEALRFKPYWDFKEPLKKMPGHRVLALRRGEVVALPTDTLESLMVRAGAMTHLSKCAGRNRTTLDCP